MARIRARYIWLMLALAFAMPVDAPPRGKPTAPLSIEVTVLDPAIDRARLMAQVFGAPTLPDSVPVGGVVTMANGFTARVLDQGNAASARTVIWHYGHGSETPSERAAIERLLAEGWRVIALDMPLVGSNTAPVQVELPHREALTIALIPGVGHNMMPLLAEITTGSPLRYFVEPVIALVNQLTAEGVQEIRMGGLSGGGWAVIAAMALDTRIDAGVSVAGSLPLSMRGSAWWGDWEQWELARLYDYADLYVMAADGRRLTLVYNAYDDCCFAIREAAWASEVQGALNGRGAFDVVIDGETRGHVVGALAVDAMMR